MHGIELCVSQLIIFELTGNPHRCSGSEKFCLYLRVGTAMRQDENATAF